MPGEKGLGEYSVFLIYWYWLSIELHWNQVKINNDLSCVIYRYRSIGYGMKRAQ
jgi:hypothetical protein